jgi:hypothetical protein
MEGSAVTTAERLDAVLARLGSIESTQRVIAANQDLLYAAMQQLGLRMGQMQETCDAHLAAPMCLAAEIMRPPANGDGE